LGARTPPAAREVFDAFAKARDVPIIECVGCTGPNVVMNHDSFNDNLAPFYEERFHRTALVEGSRFDRALTEHEQPDVVIQEFVERALMCPDLRRC
jgi:hypothetical protein